MKLTKQELKKLAKMLQQAYENQQLVVGVHGKTEDDIGVSIIADMKIVDMSMFPGNAATVDVLLAPEAFAALRGMVHRSKAKSRKIGTEVAKSMAAKRHKKPQPNK